MVLSKLTLALSWVYRNPIQFLQIAGIAGLVCFVAYFWIQHRGLQADNARLSQEVKVLEFGREADEKARELLEGSVQKFRDAQETFQNDLDRLQRENANSQRQIARLVRDLDAIEIERIIADDPDTADDVLNARFSELRRLLDDATRADPGDSGSAGADEASAAVTGTDEQPTR